jgi:uncharacterized repeat protein (TIGR03803 family)
MDLGKSDPGNLGINSASGFSVLAYLLAIAVACLLAGALSQPANAQTLTTVHSFAGNPDGALPTAKVIRDSDGNLYGTTTWGGATNYGTVFKINSQGVETILHMFAGDPDGSVPWAGLVRDAQGNLYGTTTGGGTFNLGAVFKITKEGKENVLHSFSGSPDGASPWAGLVLDAEGNVYGTTWYGGTGSCKAGSGATGCGTVYKLDVNGAETVLYSFAAGSDGAFPASDLIRDSQGNLYGTTQQGGTGNCNLFVQGCGTVFMVSKTGEETILHSFAGYPTDGEGPEAGVIAGAKGSLYGTTYSGGIYGVGAVFELTTSGAEKLVYSFGAVPNDGEYPSAVLVAGPAGNLYGTTQLGGGTGCSTAGCGTLFELTRNGNEISVPLNYGPAGCIPDAPLTRDAAGNFYGTTANCGLGYGTVFKVTP